MPQYRKKPVVIEAIQWTGDNYSEVYEFLEWEDEGEMGEWFNIETKEGTMTAFIGDWIIKEPFPTGDRDFYPCKPDVFEKTYEKIN